MTLGWCRIGTKKRHQVAAQSWQQLIPSATNVEVSGTTRTSAPAEEEEKRRETRERRASQEESSRTRRVRDQARGQARAQAREEKAQRAVVGHAVVLTSDTNVQMLQACQGRRGGFKSLGTVEPGKRLCALRTIGKSGLPELPEAWGEDEEQLVSMCPEAGSIIVPATPSTQHQSAHARRA